MKTARITLRPGFFRFVYTVFLVFGHKKNARNCLKFGRFVYIFVYKFRKSLKINVYCGERGIRTPGASQHDGFQDRCNRPLYHLSLLLRKQALVLKRCKGNTFFLILQIFKYFFA